MLVHVLNFGSNWWARFGDKPGDPNRYGRNAAYYNSTGVRCGRKVRRHWVVSGLVRFNAVGDFNPHLPERSIGQTFVCAELTFTYGGNRLLFERHAPRNSEAESYLVVISSSQYGAVDFASPVWKSLLSPVIAASQLRENQEAMLLMKPGDWIQTERGFWQLSISSGQKQRAQLELISSMVCA